VPSSNMYSRTGLCLCGGREPGGLAMQPSSMPALQECSCQALTEVNVRCRGFIHRIRVEEAGGNAHFLGFGCSLTYRINRP
jgi:hypothetical protein